jgi:hypothetical protein
MWVLLHVEPDGTEVLQDIQEKDVPPNLWELLLRHELRHAAAGLRYNDAEMTYRLYRERARAWGARNRYQRHVHLGNLGNLAADIAINENLGRPNPGYIPEARGAGMGYYYHNLKKRKHKEA